MADLRLNGKSVYDCDRDEIKMAYEVLGMARELKDKEDLLKLRPGMNVTFMHSGRPVKGVIKKLNSKTVNIEAENGVKWRVSANLVTVVRNGSLEPAKR